MRSTHSVDPVRLDSKDVIANGWFGAGAGRGRVAVADKGEVSPSGSPGAVSLATGVSGDAERSWWRRGLRFVRNAAIGLSLVAAVPLSVVAVHGDSLFRFTPGSETVRARLAEVEPMRSLVVAKDASITPMAAGLLLHALHPGSGNTSFATQPRSAVPQHVWKQLPLPDAAFTTIHAARGDAGLAAEVLRLAARGLTTAQMTYLRTIAEAPIWRDVDRLASAPAVDIIGGRFVVPFRQDMSIFELPILSFADMKSLANAGVSRAAYYVATGQPARAEAALRTVLSYGFMLIDNGSNAIDGPVGRVIVGIGRDGLHQLYTITGDRQGFALTAPLSHSTGEVGRAPRATIDVEAARQRILQQINDPAVPRTLRLEGLRQLTFATCGDVRGVLRGPSDEARGAFDEAARALARYPSERAYVDLVYAAVDQLPVGALSRGRTERAIMSAAIATSALLGNPRVAACTRVVLANQ